MKKAPRCVKQNFYTLPDKIVYPALPSGLNVEKAVLWGH